MVLRLLFPQLDPMVLFEVEKEHVVQLLRDVVNSAKKEQKLVEERHAMPTSRKYIFSHRQLFPSFCSKIILPEIFQPSIFAIFPPKDDVLLLVDESSVSRSLTRPHLFILVTHLVPSALRKWVSHHRVTSHSVLESSENVHAVLENIGSMFIPCVWYLPHRFHFGPEISGWIVLVYVFVFLVCVLGASVDVHLVPVNDWGVVEDRTWVVWLLLVWTGM